jgi:hypothetical protein
MESSTSWGEHIRQTPGSLLLPTDPQPVVRAFDLPFHGVKPLPNVGKTVCGTVWSSEVPIASGIFNRRARRGPKSCSQSVSGIAPTGTDRTNRKRLSTIFLRKPGLHSLRMGMRVRR